MKLAFLKFGSFSNINQRLSQTFQNAGVSVIEINAIDAINPKKRPIGGIMNIMLAAMTFGARWRQGLEYTPFAFRTMSQYCEKRLSALNCDAILQTQTMFSASTGIPGLPYFLYTDHTHALTRKAAALKLQEKLVLAGNRWVRLERETYHKAQMVFSMSDYIKQSLLNDYDLPAEKTCTIYPGINTPPQDMQTRDYRRKSIVFVGVDFERKGGETLLEAFSQVRTRIPDAELVIVGCRRQVDDPGVTFAGKITLDEVQKAYQRASLFVLPSIREPFGIAFLEAMACGLPCIGSRIESIPEIIEDGECGYLVEPGNSMDLADKMILLLKDSEQLKRMGANARAKARSFTWENTIKDMLGVIGKQIHE